MSKRMHLIQKYIVFNMPVIATQNTSASLYSILTYPIKFPPPHPGYYPLTFITYFTKLSEQFSLKYFIINGSRYVKICQYYMLPFFLR